MKYYIDTILSNINHLSLFSKLGLIFLTVMTPYAPIIHCLIFLVFLDLITGIWASYNEKRKTINRYLTFRSRLNLFWGNLQSRKLRYTVEKLAVYILVIMGFSFFEYFFMKFDVFGYTITKVIAGFLALVEIRSLLENMTTITGKKYYTAIFNIFRKKVEEKTGIELPDENK